MLMTKILFIYETEMPTVSITRTVWINLSGHFDIQPKFIRLIETKNDDLDWCDVLILIRPNNALSWRIAKRVKASGRFVITMCDDDLLHLPKTHPDLFWQRNGLKKALRFSSVILSSSQYLIDQMVGMTADHRSARVDTIVYDSEIYERNYESEDKQCVKIVYAAGGGQHEKMFEQYVLPAMIEVASEKPHSFSITFVSVHPDCGELEDYILVNYVKGMPLLEYRKYMEDSEFDIGVSPLEDDDFTRCKYFNKYLEYTLSGILGIYSNVEPYTYVVKDGYNGFLADNNNDSWKAKLDILLSDSQQRINCARNAQKHVRDNFNEKAIMLQLLNEIPELQETGKKYRACKSFKLYRIEYKILRIIEYAYKTAFYMKNQGFGTVKAKITSRLARAIK